MAATVEHRDALEALEGYIAWPPHMDNQGPPAVLPVSVLREVIAELKRLRAEREPFVVLMDRAIQSGLANGRIDAAVLDLAERLHFRCPGFATVRVGDRLVLSMEGFASLDAQVERINGLPQPPRPGGIPLLRRGACSIHVEEVQT